jgi:predicted glycosyltransferase
VLIHTPPQREDGYVADRITDAGLKDNYRRIMKGYQNKILYTGYILPEEARRCRPVKTRRAKTAAGRPWVLVMRGAGAYFPALIGHAIMAKKMLDPACGMLIAAGPTTQRSTMLFYADLIKKHGIRGIRLEKYIPDPYRYFRDCDAACTMAGYNTGVLLMYYRKKSIVIPHEFNHAVSSEQASRAMMLKDYLGSTILPERAVHAHRLAAEIARLLDRKKPAATSGRLTSGDFDGGTRTARFLLR